MYSLHLAPLNYLIVGANHHNERRGNDEPAENVGDEFHCGRRRPRPLNVVRASDGVRLMRRDGSPTDWMTG